MYTVYNNIIYNNTVYNVAFNKNVEEEYFCYIFVTRIFFIYLFSKSKCEK